MAEIEPAGRGGHAISSAVFTVEFVSPPPILPAPVIRELLALHSKLKDRFPRRQEATAHRIDFAAKGATREIVNAGIGATVPSGFSFDSLFSDGNIERSIILDDNKLSVVRADYTTWKETWPDVRSIFKLMLPIILEQRPIVSLSLQYIDRFNTSCGRLDFKANMVFREETKLLAPNAFEVDDLWHSHHGYFEYPKEPQPHRLLNVVEAQLFERNEDKKVFVHIKLRHLAIPGLGEPSGKNRPIDSVEEVLGKGDAGGLLDAYMNIMHERNKALLSELINDDMCAKIGLTTG